MSIIVFITFLKWHKNKTIQVKSEMFFLNKFK